MKLAFGGERMEMQELMKKKLPEIPSEIANALETNRITATAFKDKNQILSDKFLHQEAGYRRLEDGNYLVSMYCPMPGITADMIKWWFWWHPQESQRYQVWYPGEHDSISYQKKDQEYFCAKVCPDFRPNSQYPVERIGKMRMPLRIDFVEPESFGFSERQMRENNISLIICGHVAAYKGLIKHTEMAHIFKQTDDGLFMISRFWIGQTLKNPLLREFVLTDDTAKGMAEHCCVEYRNLAEILPELYFDWNSME